MKRLLSIVAIVLSCATLFTARCEEGFQGMITNQQHYISYDEFAYFLFVDEKEGFSIVKTNDEIIVGIQSVYFSNVTTAVETPETERVIVTVYPNPVVSRLELQGLQEDSRVRIYSLDGMLMLESQFSTGGGVINVVDFAPGIYILQVNTTTIKFIKK